MGLGDVPTWVAAVAAWAGVVVNALIVFVALAPIRNAKRERIARGRLVAASLSVPIGDACKYMHTACEDLKAIANPHALLDDSQFDGLLVKLENVRDWVPPLLANFKLSEAAYLEEGMGERLAQAIGAANAAIASLSVCLDAFAAANRFSTLDRVLNARRQVAESLHFLPADFRAAARGLTAFAGYCDRIFPPAG